MTNWQINDPVPPDPVPPLTEPPEPAPADSPRPQPLLRRLAGPAGEAASMLVVFLVLARLLETGVIGAAQAATAGWNFGAYLLMAGMAAVTVVAKGQDWSALGFLPESMRDPALRRTINFGVAVTAAVWVVGLLLPGLAQGLRPSFMVPPVFFAQARDWSSPAANLAGFMITIVFTVAVYGPAQELFYRGCIQGGLNRALGREFRVGRFEFGWGLILTVVMYTVGQGLMLYSPLVSEPSAMRPETFQILVTVVEGVVLGLLYEKTGGTLAPMVVHAAIGFLFFGIEFTAF